LNDIREVAQKYLIDQIRGNKTAVAVLGEPKEWCDETWNVFPLSLDPTGSAANEKVTL
jgi:hypothetical protein